MEEYLKEIIELILVKNEKLIIVQGRVKTVRDLDCDISREGQPDLLDVRFHSVLDTVNNAIKIKPKKGSIVLVGLIENSTTDAFVISYSEIEKVSVKIDSTFLEVSKDGIKAERNGQDFKTVLTDTIEAIKTGIVATSTGPASFDPSTQLKITTELSKLSQILI